MKSERNDDRVRLLVQGDDQVRRVQLRRGADGAGDGEEADRAGVRRHAGHRALGLRQGGRRRGGGRAGQAPGVEPLQGGDGAGAARRRAVHVQRPGPPPRHGRRRPDARRGRATDAQGQAAAAGLRQGLRRPCPASAAAAARQSTRS